MCSPVRDQPSFLLYGILTEQDLLKDRTDSLQTRLFWDCGIGCLSWGFPLHSGGTPNIALQRDVVSPPPPSGSALCLLTWDLVLVALSPPSTFLVSGNRLSE